ncbi:MAG: hypothetical protein CSA64_00025 [Arachnia propionica]|nr:MAG: hypothetical protein CSA64_00025 [Arachnia propionica]
MVAKLIKHEWLRTRYLLGLIFAGGTFLVLVGSGLMLFKDTLISIVAGVSMFLGFAIMVLGPTAWLVIEHYQSSFGRQGYLTHTLPTTGPKIFWTKLSYGSLVLLVNLVWGAVLGVLAMYSIEYANGNDPDWSLVPNLLQELVEITPPWLLALMIIWLLLSPAMSLITFYFPVAFGSETRMQKLGFGGPVLVYVIYYAVSQALALISLILLPVAIFFVDGQLTISTYNFFEAMASENGLDGVPIGVLMLQFVISVGLAWRTHVSWSKKIALR